MTDTTLETPVKGPTFHPISANRKLKNRFAETLFAASFLIAMVPLVWVLYTVVERGFRAVASSAWWSRSLAGVLPEQVRRRCVPRHIRHDHSGCDRRVACSSPRHHGGGLPGGVRPRVVRTDDDIHGRHPGWRAVDRGGTVHLRAVDRHDGLRAERLRGIPGFGSVDAPGRGAKHRRDAQTGSRRATGGLVCAWRSEVEDHREDRRADSAAGHHQRHPAGAGPGDR